MKKLGLVVAAIAIGWIAWPYYAIYDLVAAVQNGDQEALERRIDWQPLRQGLRDDFNSMFMRKIAADAQQKRDEPGVAFGAGLAALMGPAIIDRAIDARCASCLIDPPRQAPQRHGVSTGGRG